MELEVGKFYMTRDGRKVGPASMEAYPFKVPGEGGVVLSFTEDGRWSENGESRHDLVEEWKDEPKLWQDMTNEEKGALLLAYHEGKQIQMYFDAEREWEDVDSQWAPNRAYRVKPVSTTVSIFGYIELLGDNGCWAEWAEDADGQYVITIELENGKPVGVTIHDMYE
jgi:hypothetical protein